MKLQLDDGYMERPMGFFEKIVVSSCGIEYEHTFAIVDFGKRTNFEIILGRPFMRQLKIIQDWGYNHLYLRQLSAISRINLSETTLIGMLPKRQWKNSIQPLLWKHRSPYQKEKIIFGCVERQKMGV